MRQNSSLPNALTLSDAEVMANVLRAKCIVVGDSCVGKSALVQAFSTESSTFHKNYSMIVMPSSIIVYATKSLVIDFSCKDFLHLQTCGVDFKLKSVAVPDTEDVVELFLFDSSGKDVYFNVCSQMWDQPSMFCMVFDLTSENSFNSCNQWLEKVKQVACNLNLPGVLVGNKADLKERRKISPSAPQDFARRNNLLYFESSVKETQGIEEPFFYLVNEWHKLYLEKIEFFKSLS